MPTTIVIKSVSTDLTTRNGEFQYPESGLVEAPDWNPRPLCGGGLHGLRVGDNYPGYWYDDGKYLALEVDSADIVDLNGKCKFPKANVVYVANSMLELSHWLQKNGRIGPWYRGIVVVGDNETAHAGVGGTATAGDRGTATARRYGTATAGDEGTATAGDRGTATAGRYGTATAERFGIATAGIGGTIIIKYYDGRVRYRVGYIGKDGLKPDTPYRLNDDNDFEEVEK